MDPKTSITSIRAEVGMVFQRFNLFPHLKVLDNITLAPMQIRKWPADEGQDDGDGAAGQGRSRG